MLAARIKHGDAWSDANILNVSSRGLLLHSVAPPSHGTFVEIRRGAHIIVARVMWVNSDRFGVSTQDGVRVNELIASKSPNTLRADAGCQQKVERRIQPRSDNLEWRYARSRDTGRALEFVCVAGLGFILAAWSYEAIREALSQPMSIVSKHLETRG